MSAQVLTIEAAQKANIEVITDSKGEHAVHEVVVALQAKRRSGSACTKTRGEVNRSGRKPWRQKGTGRARAGSAGSPVWVGGGVVFGPRPRDYSKKINKKVAKLAFRKALSSRIADGDVILVDEFSVSEPKTKKFVELVRTYAPDSRKTLVLAATPDAKTELASRNVSNAVFAYAASVNTEDLLYFDKIILTKDALETLSRRTSK